MSHRVDASYLLELQHRTENIRNFCILAHVDHGKTTLSDSLVSSNGIISSRLAGKLRFLDSTEEEQKRGITMHSSAIALHYRLEEKGEAQAADSASANNDFLINLVDSPGHIDFSSDVSTAARLCDGALVVVDVLEGVCTQTHAVIYKALKERMRPCLVLNKIDRLIVELRFSPTEAFHHLRRIIENVNALAFTLVNSEYIKRQEALGVVLDDTRVPEDDPTAQEWAFAPEKGNVQFASALDGWGFGLMKFINLYHKKLGLNKGVLRKYMFEDYSLNITTKKIVKADNTADNVPMFAALVLAPIWEIYDLLVLQQNITQGVEFAKTELNVQLEKKEINPRDMRITLQAIMRRWLPLADSILRMVVRNMPNPIEAQQLRVQTLLETTNPTDVFPPAVEAIRSAIARCDATADAPLVVFVSKMMPVRAVELSKRDSELLHALRTAKARKESGDEALVVPPLSPDQEVFVALGRVFSGVLRRNSRLHVLGHKHDPVSYLTHSGNEMTAVDDAVIPEALQSGLTVVHPPVNNSASSNDILGCYLLLGPSISAADSVPAGNIVGIVGLEDVLLKTATLSSTWTCPPLKAITFQSKPMLKVAVEPESPNDLPALDRGMQALNQYDPVVEVAVDALSGQRTMTCLGELHLDQCVKALVDKFAKCQLKVSEPLVSFRETIAFDDATYPSTPQILEQAESSSRTTTSLLPPPWGELPGLTRAQQGTVRYVLETKNVAFTIQAMPMPVTAVNHIEQDIAGFCGLDDVLSQAYLSAGGLSGASSHDVVHHYRQSHKIVDKLCATFTSEVLNSNSSNVYHPALSTVLDRLIALGPRVSCPSNILSFHPECVINVHDAVLSDTNTLSTTNGTAMMTFARSSPRFMRLWQRLHSGVVAGFQEAVQSGPLMHEPVHAVCFQLLRLEVGSAWTEQVLGTADWQQCLTSADAEHNTLQQQSTQVHAGQLISETKDHLRAALLSCPCRIVEPMFSCELQCDQMQLGNLYGVLARRRGTVYREDIIEGTQLFLLSAYLPVAASFHFAQELLKKTSGSGTAPQLSFSHWQLMVSDPFWRPRTEEELEEFGTDFTDSHNLARLCLTSVRKRKGLPVDEQVVVSAEKQRTLKR